MHPHGGAISKHMAVGIQGRVPCQSTDLRSADHTEHIFEGAVSFKWFDFFILGMMFSEGALISDLCQRETTTLGISGLKSQVFDQITVLTL